MLAHQSRRQHEQWQTELKQRLEKYKFTDARSLRLETERRLRDLDLEITAAEQTEEQQQAAVNRLKELNLALGDLSGQLAQCNEDLARAQGQATGAFEALPAQIAGKEEALLRKKDEQELLIIQQKQQKPRQKFLMKSITIPALYCILSVTTWPVCLPPSPAAAAPYSLTLFQLRVLKPATPAERAAE